MEEAEKAFIWAIEKTVGDEREEDRDNTTSNKAIFTLTVQIKTCSTVIKVPGELQDFCPESLFKGNKVQWLHGWEMPRYECEVNRLVIAAYGWVDCTEKWEKQDIWPSELDWLKFAFVQVKQKYCKTVNLRI